MSASTYTILSSGQDQINSGKLIAVFYDANSPTGGNWTTINSPISLTGRTATLPNGEQLSETTQTGTGGSKWVMTKYITSSTGNAGASSPSSAQPGQGTSSGNKGQSILGNVYFQIGISAVGVIIVIIAGIKIAKAMRGK